MGLAPTSKLNDDIVSYMMSSLLLSKLFPSEIAANVISFITLTFEDYRYIRSIMPDREMKEYYDLACPLGAPLVEELDRNLTSSIILNGLNQVNKYNRGAYKNASSINIHKDVVHHLTVLHGTALYVTIYGGPIDPDAMIETIMSLIPNAKLHDLSIGGHYVRIVMRDSGVSFRFTVGDYTPPTELMRQITHLDIGGGCPQERIPDLSCCDSLTHLYSVMDPKLLRGLPFDKITYLQCDSFSPDIFVNLLSIKDLIIIGNGVHGDLDLSMLPTKALERIHVIGYNITNMFPEAPVLKRLYLRNCNIEMNTSIAPQLETLTYLQSEGLTIDLHPSLRTLHINDTAVEVASHPKLTKLGVTASTCIAIKSCPSLRYLNTRCSAVTSCAQPSIRKLVVENNRGRPETGTGIADQVFGDGPHEYIEEFGYVHALD
jgi:hypothetical protein